MGFVLCAVGCASWLNAAARPGTQRPEHKAVSISEFKFAPGELTVAVGDTVAWTNDDPLPHTTAADSGAWSSPEMSRGERFIYVAVRAGRFPYHCAAHAVMRGTLVVHP